MQATDYSRSAIMDVRDACALAITRVIQNVSRLVDGQVVKFNHVFDQWPAPGEEYDPPAACVVGPPEWAYDPDAALSPALLEDTVETITPATPVPPSFGLWRTGEMTDRFTVALRAGSSAMRSRLKLMVEDAFQHLVMPGDVVGEQDLLFPNEQSRYGLLLHLQEYWGMTARASLIGGANSDSEDAAMRNQREATFVVSVQAPKVELHAVPIMAITVIKNITDLIGNPISTSPVTTS